MFGQYLIKNNLVSVERLNEALSVQDFSDKKIGRILLELNILSKENLNRSLIEYLKIEKETSILSRVESSKRKLETISVNGQTGYLLDFVLYLGHFDDALVEEAEKKIKDFEIRLISKDQERVLQSLGKSKRESILQDKYKSQNSEEKVGAFDKFVHSLIKQAKQLNASDIHFDIEKQGLVIRMRINGVLEEVSKVDKSYMQMVMTKVRSEVGLPLSIVGKPCSGSKTFEELGIKIRSEYVPEVSGEAIVCRLINCSQLRNSSLESIGGDSLFIDPIKRVLNKKHGLILMCGQTGSGKSYTLFSALMSIDRTKKKVISIEDPVEYEGAGILQIDINKDDLSFSDALRSSLRLDPDVIMVGEIRDTETAELAMRASSTGHLVFTTLHTNGAIQAITRLKGMGISEDVLNENLELISALTLVKKLCPKCKKPMTNMSEEIRQEFCSLISMGVVLYEENPVGCEKCFKGVIGRQILAETIDRDIISEKIRGGIVPGYRTLKESAKEYACLGIISPRDVVSL